MNIEKVKKQIEVLKAEKEYWEKCIKDAEGKVKEEGFGCILYMEIDTKISIRQTLIETLESLLDE